MGTEAFPDKPVALDFRIDVEGAGSSLSLTFDNGDHPGYDPIKHPWLGPQYLEGRLINGRKLLSDWAKKYNSLLADKDSDKLTCAGDATECIWLDLATWGWELYRDLFDLHAQTKPELVNWGREIAENLPAGSRVVIDSVACSMPWGLLYDAEPDIKSETFFEHFWGLKYLLESVPFFVPQIAVRPKHRLENEKNTRLSVTINEQMDKEFKTGHKLFFETLTQNFNFPPAEAEPAVSDCMTAKGDVLISTTKDCVINCLLERQEPQHLYYYYCHHEKGDGVFNYRGYRNFEESKMVITGRTPTPATAIGFLELKQNGKIKKFQQPPVVFMNACESAQGNVGYPAGFMFYFTYMLSACVFIGTEASIPAAFADYFGRCFITRFLKGEPVGQTLLGLVGECARRHRNPFGLYYSLHGNSNTRLAHPIEEVSGVAALCNQ